VNVTSVGTCVRGPADRDDWFDVRRDLGRHGYKYLPPACRYLLVAARRALGGAAFAGVAEQARGVAVGTNNATVAVLDRIDRTVVAAGSTELSPVDVPFGTVNVLTSRLAVEHRCRAFALTTVSPVTAGLEALGAAVRALRAGRAEVVLAGAMEDQGSEAGAVVLVVRRGEGPSCTVRTLLLPPRRPSLDLLKGAVTGLVDRADLPLHVVLDGSAHAADVAAAVGDVLGRGADTHTVAFDAALIPTVRLAELLEAGTDALLLVAAGTGNVGLARITAQAGPS
jgi:3-oxoacyl-[acyl-carrier-protein] synthase II